MLRPLLAICLALPLFAQPASTNRTIWLNASDADHLFTNASTPPSGSVTNGSSVEAWTSETGTNTFAQVTSASAPTWVSSAINSLGAISFDGTNDHYISYANNNPYTALYVTDLLSASSFTVLMAFRISSDCTNAANNWDNSSLFADEDARFMIFCKTSAGTTTLYVDVYDGAHKTASVAVSQNTNYILNATLSGGTLSMAVNQGAPGTVASGSVQWPLNYRLRIGGNYSTLVSFPGYIGELVTYNSTLTGSDLTTTESYLMSKWVSGAPPPSAARRRVIN